MKHPLGKRLLSAANFVRQGAYLADIGTDHAYLPLFLLDSGRIKRAVCTDINPAPLASATRNAELYSHVDKIKFILTDGAVGLEGLGISDYTICGMGGELIADIIERSPHLKVGGVRLILQPMTKQAYLKRYLLASGFELVGEAYAKDAGKFYITLVAEYDGVVRKISDLEAELGKIDSRALSDEQSGFIKVKLAALNKAARGKSKSEIDDSYEAKIIREYERIMGAKER